VTGAFRLEVLGTQHDRTRFNCGIAALDGYFRTQATQDARRRASACYVAVQDEINTVAGFYTLAAGSVPLTSRSDCPGIHWSRSPGLVAWRSTGRFKGASLAPRCLPMRLCARCAPRSPSLR
jgi:hypothetical protein